MKFVSDNEQVFSHSTPDCKPNSEHSDSHESGLVSAGLASENSIVRECEIRAVCALDANEGNADLLPYVTNDADGWVARNLDRSSSLNDFAKDNEKNVRDLEVNDSHSCGEMESFEEPVFYMDKSVTECELPELIVCYLENTHHVKDICVDEGLRSRDRILFERSIDRKVARGFLPPEEDRNSELMEETKNSVVPESNVSISSAENNSNEDIVKRCDSSLESDSDEDTANQIDLKKEEATDGISNDVSKKLFSLGDLVTMHNVGTENSYSKSCSNNENEAAKNYLQGDSGKEALPNPVLAGTAEEANTGAAEAILTGAELVSSDKMQNDKGEAVSGNHGLVTAAGKAHDLSEGAFLTSSDLVSASDESTKISSDDKLSYNSNLETESVTFDFDASAPEASGKEEHLQKGESQGNKSTPGTSSLEDSPCHSVSGQVHSGLGESSFSAAGSLPSLISYSGPVAYSGNISLRSDSSTTSTRSFAFPVLQSEWNCSPVRMAKADRRRYRRHKWRQHLLFCCRF